MNTENRTSSAMFKRAEQLKRWKESETNKELSYLKNANRKINFSDGCVFLAACASGDQDEVLRLLVKGADIDTTNVDGLTALHQACIDDNFDMVKFLLDNGADINRGDNEGWTPLHATASCGFTDIAKVLIERGADVAAVNNDGDLPYDISESDSMEYLLQAEIDRLGIDCNEAREKEQRIMLEDVSAWLNSGYMEDKIHPHTGATSLHVAAAKGYIKVLRLLLQAGVDVNAQDYDGWTPLHAAAHWNQREACEILCENLCNMDLKNYVGQTPIDVTDPDVLPVLEEWKRKQATLRKDKPEIHAILTRKPQAPMRRRSSVTRMSNTDKSSLISKDVSSERQRLLDSSISEENKRNTTEVETKEISNDVSSESEIEKKNRFNKEERAPHIILTQDIAKDKLKQVPSLQSKVEDTHEDNSQSWRKPVTRSRPNSENLSLPNEKKNTNNKECDMEVRLRRPSNTEEEDRNEGMCGNPPSDSPTATATIITPVRNSSGVGSQESYKFSPTNFFSKLFKSFVPPVRDEESETQRKAHAKRVRETRRSTQGVALEDLKTAQQLNKDKQTSPAQSDVASPIGSTNTPTVDNKPKSDGNTDNNLERRLSWRLRVDDHDKTKFSLEDDTPSSRSSEADVTVTVPLRVRDEHKDNENDSHNLQATQLAIQRRRRPKRRSTGVVQVDIDEIENSNEEKDAGKNNPGLSSRSSRTSEARSDQNSARSSRASSVANSAQENGELDYKKLYEEAMVDNDRLRDKLNKTESMYSESQKQLEKALQLNRNAISDNDKREKRSLERKLSEMEEELRQLQKLKAENEKLKADNRALTRVVAKLRNASLSASEL